MGQKWKMTATCSGSTGLCSKQNYGSSELNKERNDRCLGREVAEKKPTKQWKKGRIKADQAESVKWKEERGIIHAQEGRHSQLRRRERGGQLHLHWEDIRDARTWGTMRVAKRRTGEKFGWDKMKLTKGWSILVNWIIKSLEGDLH